MRPFAIICTLLQLDETIDDLFLGAVDVFLVQQLHHRLPHGVAGAGGAEALVGRSRFGPGWRGDLIWVRNSKVKYRGKRNYTLKNPCQTFVSKLLSGLLGTLPNSKK